MAVKKIYYSMGEVAEMFDVNQSLIRHWESKFDCLKPHKNAKGNRMFTEADVERLKQIYHLVKERGMTLKGAAKVLRQSSQDELKREKRWIRDKEQHDYVQTLHFPLRKAGKFRSNVTDLKVENFIR